MDKDEMKNLMLAFAIDNGFLEDLTEAELPIAQQIINDMRRPE
jgi:hypothetical protein